MGSQEARIVIRDWAQMCEDIGTAGMWQEQSELTGTGSLYLLRLAEAGVKIKSVSELLSTLEA